KYAVQMSRDDYLKYDYIFGMDSMNVRNILRITGGDPEEKVYRFLDITDTPEDVADPWYTGDFDKTYSQIKKGIDVLISEIKKVSQN
ncbi:MAG: low molecular weight phosphotyrosine protein phosphatase, partial [Clostridia bacterium]|nr:low molecular weight phosphotyrosine protein phosphatase [Clostridia bacterium]